jgi:hypothetical protein
MLWGEFGESAGNFSTGERTFAMSKAICRRKLTGVSWFVTLVYLKLHAKEQ